MKKRFLSMLVLLVAVATGAWAQTETLLTTITATDKEQASYSMANVATVSFSHTANGSSAYHANWGWWGYGWTATVTAAEGYTITKCVFYDDKDRTATDSEAPFVVETTEEDKTPKVNGTPILAYQSAGIKKIEVYGYTYSITLADGTEDSDKWTISPTEAAEGATVTVTYSGTKKVKSVKAVKKGAATIPVTNITLNKTETSIKVGSTETLSVTAVAPENATDKTYTWKTSDETKATVDADGKVTAVAEGTVTIYAEANDGSGVKGNCTVTVTPATITVTINQSDWGNAYRSFTKDGVTVSAGMIDSEDGNLMDGGSFSTTLGNFTKIVVTATSCYASGTGWSGSRSSMTWAGTPASTVSFSGEFMGMGQTQTTIVCTIVPKN